MSDFRAAHYLQIPAAYCRSFGGLRWAQYGEAVEFLEGPAAGRTFAFAAEIAAFIEGMQEAGGSLVNFGMVLHLVYLVGLGERATRHGEGSASCVERIAAPFRDLGCPLRNAGTLCASLCRDVPRAADPPDVTALHEILTGGSWVPQMVLSHPLLGVLDHPEEPALESGEFENRVRRAADSLTTAEIRHWLRHGRGPMAAADDRLVPLQPRGVVETLVELEQRPRLSGIGRLASRLDGALSLPPRRLGWSLLQDGGYADVTTKGAPEQILPIQFALDGEEFLRRFAEGELLYFHREEPRQPTTEEIVLLLDQGTRTWGDVRLILAGAALALARQSERRRIAVRLATTSNGGEPVDPTRLEARTLSGLVEASDLSEHPGHALARLLQSPSPAQRDIVLLTHSKNLGNSEVVAAARSLEAAAGIRLFAVSVDAQGRLELAELRRGLPVVLTRCRVNLAEDAASSATPSTPAPRTHAMAWTGEVEQIPFPFQCGALDRIDSPQGDERRHFDFDEAGERILIVGRYGMLFNWRIDGADAEVLPRSLVDGEVLRPVKTVIGVAGGFVLVGRRQRNQILTHYDFPTRTCRVHLVSEGESAESWLYYRDLHSLAARTTKPGRAGPAIDLAAGIAESATTPRSLGASVRAQTGPFPEPLIFAETSPLAVDPPHEVNYLGLRLHSRTGALDFIQYGGEVSSVIPLLDGRPALKGGKVVHARKGGDVLAVRVEHVPAPGLYFLSLSRATVLGTFFSGDDSGGSSFVLSRDGQRFARLLDDRRLEVRDVPGGHPPSLVTLTENIWIHFATLGLSCLHIREFELGGPRRVRSACLIRWDRGRLEVAQAERHADELLENLGGTVAVSRSLSPQLMGRGHDQNRFVQVIEHQGARVLIDRYNHLAVLDRNQRLTCIFYVSGQEIAAWLPDGSRWGPRRLIGGEPTLDARERIAAALSRALPGDRSTA
jgi:hypothetical protein